MVEIPKKYDPKVCEPKWQKYWEDKKIFKFDRKSKKPFFTIDMPPPTVSGKMHVGHSFSYAQEDFFARYKRMKGFEVFFPFGTDDNGLATDKLVEKIKKVRSSKMKRKEYVQLVLQTLEEIRPDFVSDWKRLGFSADYSLFYSTINEHCQRISQKSFLDLYKAGLEYRKHAPIIFCPQCRTAIAQVEMEDKEEQSTLNYIKAKTQSGDYLIFATTRPELIFGCMGMCIDQKGTYVKIKVEKESWIVSKDALEELKEWFTFKVEKEFEGKELLNQEITIPLSKTKVKITHDEVTETKYGTGIVYYCSYGGMDCIEWLVRHPEAKPIHVMGLDGKYNEKCGKYKGMNSHEARKNILEDLEKQKDLVKKKPIKHAVNTHERCGTDIEYVATEQWFIKVLDKKEKWEKHGNELQWFPLFMKNRFDNWAKGLKWDWCISRQRHYGIPIPVWYCNKCDAVLTPNEKDLPIDPLEDKAPKCSCGSTDYTPEKDVLDTWATSSLTPQIAAGLVPELYDKLYPMDFRQNSHDIITFWLFNTLIKSQLHNKVNPWKDVLVTGWVLDPKGKKMSKSKGNVVDPREIWDKFSVDAQRFAAAETKLGSDYPFQEKDVKTGQKTVTKLWNASKFGFMHLEDYDNKEPKLEAFDQWLLIKLNKLITQSTISMDQYAYSKSKNVTENFFWIQFCDIYLEIVKDRLYNPDQRGDVQRKSGQFVLYNAIETVLKLFAPFMPYITEEVYQLFIKKEKSIHISSWPESTDKYENKEIEEIGDQLVEVIAQVRKAKSEKSLSLKEPVKEIVLNLDEKKVTPFIEDLKAVTKAQKVSFAKTFSIKL
jgi:valyl-tRNA synthetase